MRFRVDLEGASDGDSERIGILFNVDAENVSYVRSIRRLRSNVPQTK